MSKSNQALHAEQPRCAGCNDTGTAQYGYICDCVNGNALRRLRGQRVDRDVEDEDAFETFRDEDGSPTGADWFINPPSTRDIAAECFAAVRAENESSK